MNTTASAAPRALIAEDEPLLAQSLRAELARAWPELVVEAMVGDGRSAVSSALSLAPDVCFLDIRMPAMNGLEAAKALAEEWPEHGPPFPLLVFATAYDEYAVRAFESQAVDYLLKPVQPARLDRCVGQLKRRLAERAARVPDSALQSAVEQLKGLLAQGVSPVPAPARPPARLEVIQAAAGAAVHLVPVDEVLYFEAADKYVRVVTGEREHLIRMSLRELLPQLDPQRFWQVHRGTVVQVRCIRSAVRDEAGKVTLTLRGRDDKLVASRFYAHLFKGM